MAKYVYSELQVGEIRLFKLQPAEDESDEIVCDVFHVPLTSEPAYEAISYEWGSEHSKSCIRTMTGPLTIHKNLDNALRSMRSKDAPRTLWADCICVNQEDKAEVDRQLLVIDTAYESAESALVWLGNDTAKTTSAIHILTSLALLGRQRNAYAGMKGNEVGAFILRTRPKGSSLFLNNEDMMSYEFAGKRGFNVRSLSRHADLSDDEIFQFHNHELWREIDGMFWNSYFERTWIQREVAKAPFVYLYRGSNAISWPLFHAAFTGRQILQFHAHHIPEPIVGPLQTLIDARERWRTPKHGTTLAGALVALAYSKETNKHDHIYAAYVMAKVPTSLSYDRNYDVPIEELMLKTACTCIQDRNDLYHLGLWCVASRKTMNLPTWAPDFTTGTCELACEYASVEMSRLIDGSYKIGGKYIYLNCHLLDTIERVYTIGQCGDIENIITAIKGLETFFRERGNAGLFGEYVASREAWTEKRLPEDKRCETLEQLSEVRSIVKRIPGYPTGFLELVWDVQEPREHQRASTADADVLAIEALWSLLNPESRVRVPPAAPHGEPLILAWLYLTSILQQRNRHIYSYDLPKFYGNYIRALIPVIFSRVNETIHWTQNFAWSHLKRTMISMSEPECIFVTSRGFLGRTSAGDARQGDVVSFLGGGWTPYILQRQQSFYNIRSFAYIEGLAKLARLPANRKVERICLQ